jgi:hypothetical protein
MIKQFLTVSFLFLLLSTAAFAQEWKEGTTIVLPAVELRAFGVNSAEYTPYETPKGASKLVLHAESEEKAKLFYEKYQHDLALGGGAVLTNRGDYIVQGQGRLYVCCLDKTVTFLTAATSNDLTKLVEIAKLGAVKPTPKFSLPLYLKAWNTNPFRFYYWFDQPQRGVEPREYRYLPEYDWAKERQTGLIGWVDLARNESAQGISQLSTITWGMRAAERRGLPYVVNSSLSNFQVAIMNQFAADTQMGMPDFSGAFYCVSDPGHAGNRGRNDSSTLCYQ